jgi:hypothetical protein
VDYYGTQQSACPRCGSTADVRTVQDLVAMMSGQAQASPMPGPGPSQQSGYGPGPGPYAEPFYGPESGYGQGPGPAPSRGYESREYGANSPDQEIADVVLGLAGRFIGKAIKNRMQRAMEERVMPTVNARAEQQRQQMAAIAERYPELRGCLRDQVIFLAGGTRTVPMSEVSLPQVTLAQADALVAQLRQP